MRREHEIRLLITALTFDAVMLVLLYLVVTALRSSFPLWWPFDIFPGDTPVVHPMGAVTVSRRTLPLLIPIMPLWLGGLVVTGSYKEMRRTTMLTTLFRVASGVTLALLVLLALLWAFHKGTLVSRTHLVSFSVLSVPLLVGTHRLMQWSLRKTRLSELEIINTILLGTQEESEPLFHILESRPELGLRVTGLVVPEGHTLKSSLPVPVLGTINHLAEILMRNPIHKVLMTGTRWELRQVQDVAGICEDLGVKLGIETTCFGFRTGRTHLDWFGDRPILLFSRTPTNGLALFVKRCMDVVGSLLALIVFSPVLLVAAIAVKLQDGGPILFKQERCGLYGRPFQLYKFRTMVIDAEKRRSELEALNEMDGPVFKITRDPRVTRVGKILRKTSIDEFPQFWNVLRGEMSLVGPRPPIPQEVARYERWQVRRLSMKPGITCIWQVSGRNNINFETWMKLDLEYIDNWSLLLDIKLLLLTIPAVLLQKGAR